MRKPSYYINRAKPGAKVSICAFLRNIYWVGTVFGTY